MYDTRGRPPSTKYRSSGRRQHASGRPRRAISKSHYYARKRARKRRFMARRLALVLMLLLIILVLGLPLYGRTAGPEYVRAVAPVEASPMPEFPGSSGQDMTEVWDAAVNKDSSPGLATNGKTGTTGGRIALTFDDGPDPHTTPRILDTLRQQDVKATFFVVGSQVEKYPGLVRQIVNEGHTIGNHTYDHPDMSKLTAGQMRVELQSTQKAVDKALGYHYPMKIMRPPYGEPYSDGNNALPVFQRVVRQEEIFPVVWTIDTQDYLKAGNPRGIVKSVVKRGKTGKGKDRDQVVLMHDIHPQDAQALPGLIDRLKRQDREFVGVDELLADKYLKQ